MGDGLGSDVGAPTMTHTPWNFTYDLSQHKADDRQAAALKETCPETLAVLRKNLSTDVQIYWQLLTRS